MTTTGGATDTDLRSPVPPARPAGGRAGHSGVREANLALVARTVCAAPGPLSRAGVAAATTLTRSTVSRLVDDLVAGGVLAELRPVNGSGRGRPGTPLVPGNRVVALGLQVDTGQLTARVLNLRGEVVVEALEEGSWVGSDPRTVLRRVAELGEGVLERMPPGRRLVGTGLALPGLVSAASGRLLTAPNLGWSDVTVADHLARERTGGAVVRVGNEADLAAHAVAEAAPGRPGPWRDFVYLSGDIGIGGAIILDGRVVGGTHGWAGEIGHVTVDPAGPACPCGSTGCLERYAGRDAILVRAGLATTAPPSLVGTLFRAGGEPATRAIDQAAWALGVALSGVVNVLDIPTVVLGGHLGQLADVLRPGLEEHLRTRVLSAVWRAPDVVAAGTDTALGATGAALLELAGVLSSPARFL